MRSKLPMMKFLLFSLLIAAFNFSPATADESENIVKRVRERLDKIDTFSCSFVWERVWIDADRTSSIQGTIVMKRPYLLRVEYPGHVIVVDGKNTWSYLEANKQVQISDFVEGGEFPSPETIFRRYAATRKAALIGAETVNGRECDVITLTSEDPKEVMVTVWIDRNLDFPVKTLEKAQNGDSSSHMLNNIELNKPVNESLFVFQPSEGITIIDLRD